VSTAANIGLGKLQCKRSWVRCFYSKQSQFPKEAKNDRKLSVHKGL
jgi:hypothetical protein